MKVILTQEVKGKGGEGDVVDVARGYAVNFLIPRNMAVEATPGSLKQLDARHGNIEKRELTRTSDADSMAAALEGKTVTVSAKVGEEGRLFGSITGPMIEEAIKEQLSIKVDRRKIDLHGLIKEIGEHVITVQVYREIKADMTVNVIGEGTHEVMGLTAAEAAEVVLEDEASEEEEEVVEDAIVEVAVDEVVEGYAAEAEEAEEVAAEVTEVVAEEAIEEVEQTDDA